MIPMRRMWRHLEASDLGGKPSFLCYLYFDCKCQFQCVITFALLKADTPLSGTEKFEMPTLKKGPYDYSLLLYTLRI